MKNISGINTHALPLLAVCLLVGAAYGTPAAQSNNPSVCPHCGKALDEQDGYKVTYTFELRPISSIITLNDMFHMLDSERNLRQVAEAEHLDKVWGCSMEEAVQSLMGRVTVLPVTGTRLVRLSVRCEDAELSRRICLRIADFFKKGVQERIQQEYTTRLAALEFHQDKRDGYLDQFKNLAEANGIIFNPNTGWMPADMEADEEEIRQTAARQRELKKEIQLMSVHLDNLRRKTPGEALSYLEQSGLLTDGFPTADQINRLRNQLDKAGKKLEIMRDNGYGNNHPAMVRLAEQRQKTQADLDHAVMQFKLAMQNSKEAKEKELEACKMANCTARANWKKKVALDKELRELWANYNREQKICYELETELLELKSAMDGKPEIEENSNHSDHEAEGPKAE